MNEYNSPEMEVVEVSSNDIITASAGIGVETTAYSERNATWSFNK